MKKILYFAAIFSILNFQFSIAHAQQPDAVYKLLRYEWTLNPDGSSDFHYRHEVQILRNRALTAYADKGETFVVYNPDLEELTINEVYTRQLDGTRVDMPQNAFVYQLPSECADCGRFNHIRELAMVHTGMELGCVIVVDYTIHRQYNLLHESIPLQRECPVERLEATVHYNTDIDVKYNILGNQYLPKGGTTRVMSVDENNDRKLEYTFLNLPQAPREPYMPADIIPTLRLYNSTPEHTPAFDQAPFKGASDAMGQVAVDSDPYKSVTAIRNFVVSNIHLNDIHPSHLGYIHSTPEVTWQTGCGTAIDKAVLLTAILNNEGYRARVIGENMDEVGVFIDTVEYRLDIRHRSPIEVNGEAKDEVKQLAATDEIDAANALDTLEGGFLALNVIKPLDGEPEVQASRLALSRTTPLVGSACDLSQETTYLLPKGLKMVGGDINQSLSFKGIGSMQVSIKQDGKNLKVVRKLKIEKSIIDPAEYSQYRQLLAAWQAFEGRTLLFRAK